MSSVAGFCSVTDARFSRALQPGLGSVSQGDVSALPALPETGGKAIFGSGRVSQGPLPSSRPVRAYRRVALGRESVPHSLRRKRPPTPQLSASVQPLLAHTSLSSHPIFTSSVYTLATASKSASPLLLPWTPATASSEHTEGGAACSRRRTRRGEDGPATFQRGRRSPGFRRFFLVTCPPVSDSGPV